MSDRETFERIKAAEGSRCVGDSVQLLCPAHDDRNPSLNVRLGDSDKLLVKCHAGCSFAAVMEGLRSRGLVAHTTPSRSSRATSAREVLCVYDYKSAAGALLYQVLRYPGKRFVQRRPDGGGWKYSLKDVERVLYNLPALLAAPKAPVWIFEGEKDCDLAISMGLLATTNSGGAKKWRSDYNEVFEGREVMLVPDNDVPGREHVSLIAHALTGQAKVVRIIALPGLPNAGDFSDFIRAGGTLENLKAIAARTRPFNPDETLITLQLDEVTPKAVEWLWPNKIPMGKVTLIAGDPNLGKSFLTLDLSARVTRGSGWPDISEGTEPGRVLLMNAEDDAADTIVPRLISADAKVSEIELVQGVALAGARESSAIRLISLEQDLDAIQRRLRADSSFRLVVIDPISAYLTGIDSNSNTEVRRLLTMLSNVAAETSTAIVVISHLRKNTSGKAIYRTMGSLAFTAAARAVWTVIQDPFDANDRRLFLPVKNNLTQDCSGLAFCLADNRVRWIADPVDVNLDNLIAPSGGKHPDAARRCIIAMVESLADGAKSSTAVKRELAALGFSRDVIREAKRDLQIEVYHERPDLPWMWCLPAQSGTDDEFDDRCSML